LRKVQHLDFAGFVHAFGGVCLFVCFDLKNKVLNSPVLSPWCFTSNTGDRSSSQPCQMKSLKQQCVFGGERNTKKPTTSLLKIGRMFGSIPSFVQLLEYKREK